MFDTHYAGSTDAGLIRGGYHYGHPNSGSGADQAAFFIANGGGWTSDGITMPGMLDIEYNPGSGNDCYDLDPDSIVSWVSEFVEAYNDSEGVYPMIYTNLDWWSRCAGNSNAFIDLCPLVVARYSSSVGELPGGWPFHTIWQYSDAYEYGGDADSFNGSEDSLKKLAMG
jgi:GH25 family lysozyme M1 (1,4-beta-N-acetylmuramidase)